MPAPAEPVLSLSESVHVEAPPERVYDLVSDVPRTGEWSPVCEACWWDEGDGPVAGAWFTGRNVTPTRTWETRSQVEVASRPTTFAWLVGQGWVRWAYTLAPEDGGTRLTESWQFLPAGIAGFRERYGEDADAQVAERSAAAVSGVPATLAAIKRLAEAG